ncbi:MAG: hypothetical protein P794_08910 [Epsilonproteobacteria bacterium (ex Lamellibrachia satsuma)]|nr:MAG: hypothetical protein P794_08910 [Epsilonproteobacteria bacterium (ex Lamellibrachia satsuma)]
MRKIFTILGLSFLVAASMPSVASANAKRGQKLFKKKFRKKCGFSGVRFARNHTQDEWEEIYDEGKFQDEAKKICPRLKLKKIKPAWWKHVYDFSEKYASDGIVPKC